MLARLLKKKKMRAIDYGMLHFGGYSYKDSTSNIYTFNEDKTLIDLEDENPSSSIEETIVIEATKTSDTSYTFEINYEKEILSYETFDYIINTGIITVEEIKSAIFEINGKNIYTTVYKIGEQFFVPISKNNIGESSFSVIHNDIIVSGQYTPKSPTTKEERIKVKKRQNLGIINDSLSAKKLSVVVFMSSDGALLERAYQSIEPFDNETVLFIEKKQGLNLFGSVVRVKLGNNISNPKDFPSKQVSQVIESFKDFTNISQNTLQDIIEEQIESKTDLLFFVKRTLGFINNVTSIPANISLEVIGSVFKTIADGIGTLKLDENRWKYYNDDGSLSNKANLLIPGIELFNNLANSAKTPKPSELNSNALEIVSNLENFIRTNANSIGQQIPFFKGKFVRKFIDKILNTIAQVKAFLKNPATLATYLAKQAFIAYNAFIVGIINGLIEAIKGLFDLISMVANGLLALNKTGQKISANVSSYLGLFIEMVENQLEAMFNLFSVENLKAILDFLKKTTLLMFQLPMQITNWLLDGGASINIDKLAYYIGYIFGIIIEMALEILATGGASTVVEAIEQVGKSFADLFKGILNLTKFVKKGAGSLIDNTIVLFAYIREKSKNIKPLLDDFLKFVESVFARAKDFLATFPKAVKETYQKFGVEIREVPKSPALYTGIPIKVSDDIYALIKDGKEIFRGTKKEVEAIADKLKGMSDDVAKKYLDELIETKKLDDYINNQNFKFRKLGYKFTHTFKRAKDGVLEINHYLKDLNGDRFWQGSSTISKDGVLFNVFEVKVQKVEVSTAMYKLLDKYGFVKVEAHYGSGSLGTNYKEFMKVYNKILDNRVEAAFATPGGKALNKALSNKFIPDNIIIRENDKIELFWIKKL